MGSRFRKSFLAISALCFAFLCGTLGCSNGERIGTALDTVSVDEIDAKGVWVWSEDTDCILCHTDISPESIPCLSAMGENASCFSCHDAALLASLHSEERKDKITSVRSSLLCLACHVPPTFAAVPMRLAPNDYSEVPTTSHFLPQNRPHTSIPCASCHTIHNDAPRDRIIGMCYSCHNSEYFNAEEHLEKWL